MPTYTARPTALEQQLIALNRQFVDLSTMVEKRVRQAAEILARPDPDVIEELIDNDDEVDDLEVQIEEQCLRILTLHQPFASDLRFLISVIRVNNELERIADITVNIAMRALLILRVADANGGGRLPFDFTPMGSLVREMLTKSINSFINRDTDLARTIFTADEEVDMWRNRCYEHVTETLKQQQRHPGSHLNTYILAQNLERIGDRAVNIAEEAVYLVEGKVTRFP